MNNEKKQRKKKDFVFFYYCSGRHFPFLKISKVFNWLIDDWLKDFNGMDYCMPRG